MPIKEMSPRNMKQKIRRMIIAMVNNSDGTDKKYLIATISLETSYSNSFIENIIENLITVEKIKEDGGVLYKQDAEEQQSNKDIS